MVTARSSFGNHALAATVFVFVLGSLSMIWPGIIALIFGLFLLLQSLGVGQEMTVLSSAEINNLPIVFASLLRSGPLSILS
jgi:hypothetical protein